MSIKLNCELRGERKDDIREGGRGARKGHSFMPLELTDLLSSASKEPLDRCGSVSLFSHRSYPHSLSPYLIRVCNALDATMRFRTLFALPHAPLIDGKHSK